MAEQDAVVLELTTRTTSRN